MALPTTILCPIDFSPHSERALRHALALTGAFGGHLSVVTINDPMLVAGAEAAGYGDTPVSYTHLTLPTSALV